MPWVRIDDHFDEHPKMQKIGPIGWGVWLAGLAYCNRNLTDGFIPWSKARSLCSFEIVEDDGQLWTLARTCGMSGDDIDANWVTNLLVIAGLWEEVPNGRGRIEGYQIHDYGLYQPLKADVLKERETNAAKQRSWQEKKKKNNDDPNVVSNPVTNRVTNDVPVPVPNPVPRTSVPKGTAATVAHAPASNGAHAVAAADSYRSVIGEATCTAVAEQFRAIAPALSPGWFGAMLHKTQGQVGPASRSNLEEAVKVTLTEVERRLSAERGSGGGKPIGSIKRFTEAVFVGNLSDALGVET